MTKQLEEQLNNIKIDKHPYSMVAYESFESKRDSQKPVSTNRQNEKIKRVQIKEPKTTKN